MPRLLVSIIFVCSCLFAWLIGSRLDFVLLSVVFLVAFLAYYFLVFKNKEKLSHPWFWAVVLRLPFLFALPYLSDDFYRFVWDGMLQLEAVNPYLYTPQQVLAENPSFDVLQIFEKLNSQSYFSVYPAVNQYFFAFAAKLGGNSLNGQVLALKLVILSGDVVVLFLLQKVGSFNKKQSLFALYAFNPLVLLEFSGNLHFEVWVIALVLAAYYLYQKYEGKIILPAVLFGLAISTKLLPALFLPLIWKYLGFRKGLAFCFIAMLTFSISFIPYFELVIVQNIAESVDLFFRNFEFNASFYYLLRWLGFQLVGYNWIGSVGLLLKVLTLGLVLIITWRGKSFPKSAILIYLVYLLFSTTVHPWYILPLFVLSLFTELRSIMIWTALVFLSYHAYRNVEFEESMWVVGVEYCLLFLLLLKESGQIFQNSPPKT